MSSTDELWASKARPKRLRLSLERLWLEGENVWSLSTSVTSTKSVQPAWFTVERYEGEHAAIVAAGVVEAHVAYFRGNTWATKPLPQQQSAWEQRLLEF